METTETSMDKFRNLIDSEYPTLKNCISYDRSGHIGLDVDYDTRETWEQVRTRIGILEDKRAPIKSYSVSVNERFEFFRVNIILV